jgi:hypothetical protein
METYYAYLGKSSIIFDIAKIFYAVYLPPVKGDTVMSNPDLNLDALAPDELPEDGAVIAAQEVVPASRMSDAELKAMLGTIPELAHMPGVNPRAIVDLNNPEEMELTHPDDLEPGDTRARMKYFDFVQPQLMTVLAMRRRGDNNEQIAQYLGIGLATLTKYILQFPEFAQIMAIGKANYVAHLENVAAMASTGYTKKLTYEKIVDGATKSYSKEFYYPPQPEILKASLKQYAGWQDKTTIDGTIKHGIADLLNEVAQRQQEERMKELPPPE